MSGRPGTGYRWSLDGRLLRAGLTLIATLGVALPLTAQAPAPRGAGSSPALAPLAPAVTFLARPPVIDGVLDGDLARLPVREFTAVEKDDPANPTIAARYRLAYGADFLYLYVEADAPRLVYRDRAYQNGDGFSLVLAAPRPDDAPSDEFYVLSCSAVDRPAMAWTRHVFWYYNVTHLFLPTSDDTRLATHQGEGRIAFELLLPWRDVHPYHPWLSSAIGFNLRFVKATENGGRNFYLVVQDEVGAENRPRRYVRLAFGPPRLPGDSAQSFVLLERNNVRHGDSLRARVAILSGDSLVEDLRLAVRSGEGGVVRSYAAQVAAGPGVSVHDLAFATGAVPAGGYRVEWRSRTDGSRGSEGLTILPTADFAELRRHLAAVRDRLRQGSVTTLEFRIDELAAQLAALKPYETATDVRIGLADLADKLERAARGEDAIAEARGFARRAYRSRLDNTLQPYAVWVPPDFDARKRYPLLVYLHGSASDETNLMDIRRLIPDGFIALGPRGRGPSNLWTMDNAQDDVAEAIRAVERSYPIDSTRIVLAGFSMGGYGVYRTFYETPRTFRALVVLSGSPDMATRWTGSDSLPDFTRPRYLQVFRGVPIFVFHGRRDRNVPFDRTAAFVEQLKGAGARVEFHVEDDKGHESPGDATVQALFAWLRRTVGSEPSGP
jgi:predicted esterase